MADDLAGQLLDDLVGDISYAIKLQALHIGEKVTGADRRLSRFGTARSRGRTRLGVNYKVNGGRSVIDMKPAAMWALTTGGARPHLLGAGRRTRSGKFTKQRGGRKLLVIDGRVVTGPVRHPGSRGRSSLDRVYAQIPRIVTETIDDALGERLD
ncbi:MAG: hypothetical protein ABWZ99_16330 [Ilumatobacteraceae bacterium]